MTPQRWQRIDRIFKSAIERTPAERADFLIEVCADDDSLRAEVESLISAHEQTGEFLDSPAYEGAGAQLADEPARLAVGQNINHYQVLGMLGVGGMGEVYLAHDNKLGRKVALKLLPAYFARDEQRARRFEQEARAASALSHPNVCVIHEIDKTADGRHFIAMEYIEGSTLRQLLGRERLKVLEALEIATQVAAALAAAHRAGVVNRDVKPENVMIRSDSLVKVLDFGLAKRTAPPIVVDTQLNTGILVNTAPGVLMGTVAYMSPEQVRGLQVDARTDIWSLGVVLYEMVTGATPFAGATASDVIVSILEREPPPLTQHLSTIPAALQRIVAKALIKDREQRYQEVEDLLFDLKSLRQGLELQAKLAESLQPAPSSSLITTAVESSRSTAAPAQTSSAEYIVSEIKQHKAGVLVVLLLIGGAGAFGVYRFAVRSKPPVVRFQNMKIIKLTTTGNVSDATISPDGKYVVYAATDGKQKSLWTKYLPTGSTVPVVPPTEASGLGGTTFSPDGNFVYYVLQDKNNPKGTLFQVPVLGGMSKKVLENVSFPITFSPDGQQFAFARRDFDLSKGALMITNADGTGERQLAALAGDEGFMTTPSWSPDGKLIACGSFNRKFNPRVFTISAVAVDSGAITPLTSERFFGGNPIAWFRDGSGLVFIANVSIYPQIWQLSYPSGEVRRITNDLTSWRSLGVTADGSTIVTTQNERKSNIWLAPANSADAAHAKPITTLGQHRYGESGVAWTPDGKIVYSSVASGSNNDIWIMNADGTGQKQLTDNPLWDGAPVVTPDGRYIVFGSFRSDGMNVWRMDIDGGNLKQLTNERNLTAFDLTPHEQWVFYSAREADKDVIRKIAIDGGAPVQIGVAYADSLCLSPDGKLLAYFEADPKARTSVRLVVIPAAGGAPLKMFDIAVRTDATNFTSFLIWSPDGRALLYLGRNPRGGAVGIWRQPLNGGAPTLFADFAPDNIDAFAYSRDGKQLAIALSNQTSDAVLISEIKQ